MSRVFMIIGFLGLSIIQVAAHGHLSIPSTRDVALGKRQDEQNAPNAFPLASDFVCRNYPAQPSSMWTTLVAGTSSPIQWAFEAAHPGDCFAYLSYDVSLPDTQKKWFKVAEYPACNLNNLQTMQINVPSNLPSADHAILRWEWYALHLQSINIVEFYSQCADVRIVGSASGSLPTPMVTIPGHLPMDAQYYRPGYNSPDTHLTGPPIATVGGAAWSCTATYGNSCNVPSPTNNPCVISTQRCVSPTNYQACGIGATTTIWYAEQSCQTGLVCLPTSDGNHIMCTYPTIATPTPTPASIPAPASVPPSSNPTPTPITPPSSSSSSACVLGKMRCASDSTFQTCTNGATANYWANPQSCQTGLYCVPNGDYIYCGSTRPASSTPSGSTSTSSSTPRPTSTPSSTPASSSTSSGSARPAPSPSPSTVGSSSTSTSANGSSTPSSTACHIGDQKCAGTSTYQTCATSRDGTGYWGSTQNCQTGLSCHASSTGNNIYCY